MKINLISRSILVFGVLLLSLPALPCSMYKVTVNGHTRVGCNEDAWRTTPHIWFESKNQSVPYSAAFTGSRSVGENAWAPQSGMNDQGLIFSRLAAATPKNQPALSGKRLIIENPITYLKSILHSCRTVEEVRDFISRYDHSYFPEDVFIYIDKSGKYLVVEPFTMTIGTDATYVLANFCPSVTSDDKARHWDRYRKGRDLLNFRTDTSLAFCRLVSDTMHVNRIPHDDGTLLTSIWNPDQLRVNLYFYHNYDTTIGFDLQKEWAAGDHSIALASLFPLNAGFEKLKQFKTPFNSALLNGILTGILLVVFPVLILMLLIPYFRKNTEVLRPKSLSFLLVLLNVALMYYVFQLLMHQAIYFFPAPYKEAQPSMINALSYLPFLLTLLILPLIFVVFRSIKNHKGFRFSTLTLLLNTLVYLALLILFGYWGFLVVF